MSLPSEAAFESHIVDWLTRQGGYQSKFGSVGGVVGGFDPVSGLDVGELLEFVIATQGEEWKKVCRTHGSVEVAREAFVGRLERELDARGTVDVLRHGLVYAGVEKAEFALAFFRPVSGLNPWLAARYAANRLTAVRQLRYRPGSAETLDLGLFVNGIPVATAELKNPLTGQTVEDAKAQFVHRDFGAGVLRRAVVHFAVDTELAFMTTRAPRRVEDFLPFNQGDGGGSGNPSGRLGHRSAYLWEEVWERDAWLDLLGRFVHTDGEVTIFPRFHQWRAVRRLEAHAEAQGTGESYLVQHSAGSGKSNTIAWLAHRLSSLHSDDVKVFDKVVVITDRVVLDRQLQDTIYQFEHVHGVVEKIDRDSAQLAEALAGERARIIITTLQKFPFVMDHIDELQSRRYAVIIDEAHSSQTGDTAKEMKKVLGSGFDTVEAELVAAEAAEVGVVSEVADPVQDALAREVAARGRQLNMSFFAFTATPKARTLELFGKQGVDGQYEPFDLYSMRQAIEEGFIHDVLANYVTYQTYFKIDKAISDDPELDSARARTAIARFVSLHDHNLAQRADVIVNHYRRHVAKRMRGKAKAMVVTASRLHALRYKQALDRYCADHGIGGVHVLVAFSGQLEIDGETFTESNVNGFPDSQTPEQFNTDAWQILVVAEKYQTGFDQPKLYAMYVDKILSGLAAVQTLSRLNRTHPDKVGTFVLDFRNSKDHIQEAFKPWYGKTVAPPTDPHLLYDTHAQLDRFGVLAHQEVETFVRLLLENPERNHARINGVLGPAVDRFNTLDTNKQDDFRDVLTRFMRIYSFLSQVVSFTDVKLERDYLYCRALSRLLTRPPGEGLDLGDSVELTHYAMEETFSGDASLDTDGGQVTAIFGGAGKTRDPDETLLSEIVQTINKRFGTNISETDRLFTDQISDDLVASDQIQIEAAANDETAFAVGFDKTWINALTGRMSANETFAFQLLDNEELRAAVVAGYMPDIYRRARVARQRTCAIGDLIGPDREDTHLEYKSTLRWDIRRATKAKYIEDAVIKTIAGFANSRYGGTLLIGVADDGTLHGLEDDYATFSKRGQRGDRDLWSAHLTNLLQRLGQATATLVSWEHFTINGHDIARVNIEPSDYPVYHTKNRKQVFYWRFQERTTAITDETERERIIKRRWG